MRFSPVGWGASSKSLSQRGTHGGEDFPTFGRVRVVCYRGVIVTPCEPPTSGTVSSTGWAKKGWARLATSVCQLRHDQMEQGPTEPHAGRSTFLLSSGGAGGGYYSVAVGTGPIATENPFPYRTLVACLGWATHKG